MNRIRAFLMVYDRYWSTRQTTTPKQAANPAVVLNGLIRSFIEHQEFNLFFVDFDSLGKDKWKSLQELQNAFPGTKIFRCRNYWKIKIDIDFLRAYAR